MERWKRTWQSFSGSLCFGMWSTAGWEDYPKMKKYLNKCHICWGKVQPALELPPLSRLASLAMCMDTPFLEANMLMVKVNTDLRQSPAVFKTAELMLRAAVVFANDGNTGFENAFAFGYLLWGKIFETSFFSFIIFFFCFLYRPL